MNWIKQTFQIQKFQLLVQSSSSSPACIPPGEIYPFHPLDLSNRALSSTKFTHRERSTRPEEGYKAVHRRDIKQGVQFFFPHIADFITKRRLPGVEL